MDVDIFNQSAKPGAENYANIGSIASCVILKEIMGSVNMLICSQNFSQRQEGFCLCLSIVVGHKLPKQFKTNNGEFILFLFTALVIKTHI